MRSEDILEVVSRVIERTYNPRIDDLWFLAHCNIAGTGEEHGLFHYLLLILVSPKI